MNRNSLSRRSVLLGMTAFPLLGLIDRARAGQSLSLQVFKDASCGCCGAWVEHMRAAGFSATVVNAPDMEAVKKRYNVPENLYSCHTAVIGNFIVEGHVPASAVRRMLNGGRGISGLSAAGMPAGSPGMEMPGGAQPEYEVTAFGPKGQSLFARFKGSQEV